MKKKGLITLCFNAHLPFAKFDKTGGIFQERWFFEAMLESYLPIYSIFKDLAREKIPFSVLISISPTLITLLRDENLQTKFVFYMHQRLAIANKGLDTKECLAEKKLLEKYIYHIDSMIILYKQLGGDLLNAVKNAQDAGYCEIITSMATMAFLPLYASFEYAVEAQITTAIKQYQSVFHKKPKGIFLPYGGYYPGLDVILKRLDIKYFITAGRSALQGTPKASMGVFSPVFSEVGLVAFPRYSSIDTELWGENGFAYRECYRNFYTEDSSLGFTKAGTLTGLSTADFFDTNDLYVNGFKYRSNRLDRFGEYDIYSFDTASNQIKKDSEDFFLRRCKELEELFQNYKKVGLIFMVIDLELLGHRWFEGIFFIKEFFYNAYKNKEIEIIVPQKFIKRNFNLEKIFLNFASWGNEGYTQVWLDQRNDWLIRHLFRSIEQMKDLAERFPDVVGLKRRVLDQAAREVLLAMAGDWPLLLSQRINEEVAINQLKKHLLNFKEIYEAMSRNAVRALWLTRMERENDIFKFNQFSYKVFIVNKELS